MGIELVTVDMDETFLRNDKTYDVNRFEKLLAKLREENIIFNVASGNGYYNLDHFFSEDIRGQIYFSGDDGNHIIKEEETLLKRNLSEETIWDLIDFVQEYDDFAIILSAGTHSYTHPQSGWIQEQIEEYYPENIAVDDFAEIDAIDEVTRFTTVSELPLDEIKELMDHINDQFQNVTAVTAGDGFINATAADGGKGASIQYLQEKYDISAEHSIAFGDSLNDASMMSEVKYSVAVANADDELIERCKYKIGTNEEQAVLDILEGIVSNENMDFMDDYLIE